MLDDVDPDIVERIVETGASVDEISEAIHLLSDDNTDEQTPSTSRVVEVRAILSELVGEDEDEAMTTTL